MASGVCVECVCGVFVACLWSVCVECVLPPTYCTCCVHNRTWNKRDPDTAYVPSQNPRVYTNFTNNTHRDCRDRNWKSQRSWCSWVLRNLRQQAAGSRDIFLSCLSCIFTDLIIYLFVLQRPQGLFSREDVSPWTLTQTGFRSFLFFFTQPGTKLIGGQRCFWSECTLSEKWPPRLIRGRSYDGAAHV